MSRIDELFELAGINGVVAVKVVYPDGGFKAYLTDGGSEPPRTTVILHSDDEEEVFLLFRYPELYSKVVEQYVNDKLLNDENWRNRYWSDTYVVRSELRSKFKDQLYTEARAILKMNLPQKPEKKVVEVSEPKQVGKPVYKSKTVVGNVVVGAVVALLSSCGIDVSPETIVMLFTLLNMFFRAITKEPIV